MVGFTFDSTILAGAGNGATEPVIEPDSFGAFNVGGAGIGDGDGDTIFDPERHISRDKRNTDGTYRRKRRRRNGGSASGGGSPRQARTSADHKASVEGLTNMLLVVHMGLSGALKAPEMVLEDDEGKSLAVAISNVLNEFDIRPDPKIEALVGLGIIAAGIYGPRMYLIQERNKRAKKEKTSPTIVTFPGAPGYNGVS